VNLNRYDLDPLRDPLGPDYDWNGRDAATMWPAVTTLAQIDGVGMMWRTHGCQTEDRC
jgi:hypothetical protein